jgi:predicted O-methyltransferase YrrM
MNLDGFTIEIGPRGVSEIRDANRNDLAKLIATNSKRAAEIGVAHGKYSEILMDANPDLKLYGVDPYTVYDGYKDYALKRTMAALRADAHTRLDRFPNYEFVEKFSVDAAKDFEDGSLDAVYIDANHADPYVTQDIEAWAPKVRKGGIVSGHDYVAWASNERYDVISAVHRYTKNHDLTLYIWGLNSKEDKTLKRDNIRSWMFFN